MPSAGRAPRPPGGTGVGGGSASAGGDRATHGGGDSSDATDEEGLIASTGQTLESRRTLVLIQAVYLFQNQGLRPNDGRASQRHQLSFRRGGFGSENSGAQAGTQESLMSSTMGVGIHRTALGWKKICLSFNQESSKSWLAGKFTELRLLLDEEEVLAKKFIDKNVQLTLQVYREQAEAYQEQIRVINTLSSRVCSISQESNPVQKLQAYTATEQELQQQMSLGELCQPVPVSFEPVKSFFKGLMEALQSTLQKPLDIRLKENARTPTLDPDTMHARLRLSPDLLTVRCALLGRLGPTPALRFDALWQVLSRDCFAAGRHYWEVDVQEAGAGWGPDASLRRRGDSAAARLGCNLQSWCLKRYDLEYWAFHDGQRCRLRPRDDPYRLGVFLDYEAGVLAFYDVTGGMSHLHTFRATFHEPLYPALRLWEGAISIHRLP
ncbi:Tripartite motif-containing protein 14 [Tupaia chinensis]|uniref:Tripartite motif-containing protein 14 n=1 Tax=Tupaia chinensis TaxID=246437 RepID=L9L517_TUPCH|nr:Tripartite motif-containing protein 14 [Tupaia chinensis]